jgi:hypothetical protein
MRSAEPVESNEQRLSKPLAPRRLARSLRPVHSVDTKDEEPIMNSVKRKAFGAAVGFVLLASSTLAQAQDEPPSPPPVVIVQPTEPAPPPVVVVQPAEPAPPPPVVVVQPYQEQRPVMVETESSPRGPLIASGLVSFGISYGAAVAVAATSNHQGDNRLYVPVLGPWLDLGDRGSCNINNSACDGETTSKVLLVVDGIFQGAGVLAVVGGILAPSPSRTLVSDTRVHVVPVSYGSGAPGLAAFGRF